MKEWIAHCFNKSADTYDSAALVQAQVAHRLVQRMCHITAKNILEIGCGTGVFSQHLITTFPNAALLATDIAESMVNRCQKRFMTQPQVKLKMMDGERLKLDKQYDLIASSMSVHWFTNIRNSFSKIISHLSIDGHFVFAMVGKNSFAEWKFICDQFNIPAPIPVLPDFELLQTDFPDMKIETEMMSYSYKNIRDFLSSLKKIGAVATYPSYQKLSSGKLRQILRAFDNDIAITYEIIFGHYVKQ